MIYVADAVKAKKIDMLSSDIYKIPSVVLMERAALKTADIIKADINDEASILAISGSGNNGGDAIATARILYEYGYNVSVYLATDVSKLSELARLQYEIAVNSGVNIVSDIDFKYYNVIVDGIFGIGLNKEITGSYKSLIEKINISSANVYSIDIPSGINATTGKIMGCAIESYKTVTYGVPKTGHMLYPGYKYTGILRIEDIGFPAKAVEDTELTEFVYDESDMSLLPKRCAYSNKGTYGKVLVIAGSKGMSGAAYLSAKAAYRTGCGLVKIYTTEDNRSILQTSIPEAIIATYEEDIINHIKWADAIVVGPGIGTTDEAKDILYKVLDNANVPVVIDADAINILSEDTDRLKNRNIIITPHLKEMSRLCKCSVNDIKEDIIGFAVKEAAKGIICVLKDARTIVSDSKKNYINISGNNGMATGGSGDVLTGIIASLLAQGLDRFTAATLGVYVHGLAGDDASDRLGEYSVMAGDIIDSISNVVNK